MDLQQIAFEHEQFVQSLPHYFRDLDRHKQPSKIHHDSKKYFAYIPLYARKFLVALTPLLEKKKSFLDVGCGMGDKLALVHKIAPHVRVGGIEFHKPYVKLARKIAPNAHVYHCNALHYADYHKWDIIYAYRPISHWDTMCALEERIMREMKRGATFVMFLPCAARPWVKKRLKLQNRNTPNEQYHGAAIWWKP